MTCSHKARTCLSLLPLLPRTSVSFVVSFALGQRRATLSRRGRHAVRTAARVARRPRPRAQRRRRGKAPPSVLPAPRNARDGAAGAAPPGPLGAGGGGPRVLRARTRRPSPPQLDFDGAEPRRSRCRSFGRRPAFGGGGRRNDGARSAPVGPEGRRAAADARGPGRPLPPPPGGWRGGRGRPRRRREARREAAPSPRRRPTRDVADGEARREGGATRVAGEGAGRAGPRHLGGRARRPSPRTCNLEGDRFAEPRRLRLRQVRRQPAFERGGR